MAIRLLEPGAVAPDVVAGLGALLVDAVEDGVSADFLAPLPSSAATDWWACALAEPDALTWVAVERESVVGCVRLVPAASATGAHRAEVTKFLVLRAARGRGHGRALLTALEEHAAAIGRWLLTLDTETGTPAEAMYERWGWPRYGVLADPAARPDGVLAPSTFFAKRLRVTG